MADSSLSFNVTSSHRAKLREDPATASAKAIGMKQIYILSLGRWWVVKVDFCSRVQIKGFGYDVSEIMFQIGRANLCKSAKDKKRQQASDHGRF